MKVNRSHLNVIAVYAPTEVDDETESEKFYEVLQQQIDESNRKDFVIVLRDFNARFGALIISSRLHGSHNTDVRNRNETRLVDFFNNSGLIITNTIFSHKKIHQWMWHHPNQKGGHVLDYVLISHQHRSRICDTKISRKTIHISDHNLVISKIILNTNRKYTTKKNFNNTTNKFYTKITNPTKFNADNINKFKEKLGSNLEDINFHEPIENTYKLFKESFVNATIKTLPKKSMPDKQWITDEMRKLCEEKSKYHLQIKSLKANGHAVPQGLTHCYNQAKALSKKNLQKSNRYMVGERS